MNAPPSEWEYGSEFDGKETGCGEILIDLRLHFRDLPAGTLVLVTARDEGAPLEMPAWCRMTGHTMVDEAHPFYLVRVRERSE